MGSEHAVAVANQQAITAMNAHAGAQQWASALRRLDPGVFWVRTGGKTHRVMFRREIEYAPDGQLGADNIRFSG
jgi:hypothetical protein